MRTIMRYFGVLHTRLLAHTHKSPKKYKSSLELGLVLSNQPLASAEVSLSRAPAAVLGLVPLEVRIVLDELHEGHRE